MPAELPPPLPPGAYARWGKRGLDALGAALLLLALAPLLLAVALAVRLALGRPVLFRQSRAGRHGRPFTLIKFRSMREGPGEDAERLGRFGRLLRASALDELPQLINVLRGEMSLVGPRPLPLAYLPRYTPAQRSRLRARPGLAGPAQAAGRNAVPWEERLARDALYVQRISVCGDFRAGLGTIFILLKGHGVNAPGHATMPRFDSNVAVPPPDLDRDLNIHG
ncbi:sugar transferase [Pseudoroseomonas cervicalis]|uniref:sugar transferase n=1 Tax=Teichococcus cervicalis TaxID=204525 RepID=UPI00278237D7|nr:sugar transferase [Pseudoroseomonas cervicalis]MDQ1080979.1 lipopolysaccharide/colanic/teichoic acid biosynthesis glycosyltransferase [Pseudoroseomonas cervicalis]